MSKLNITLQELEATLVELQKSIEAKGYRTEFYYSISRTLWRTPYTMFITIDIITFDGEKQTLNAYGEQALEKINEKVNEFLTGPKDEQ